MAFALETVADRFLVENTRLGFPPLQGVLSTLSPYKSHTEEKSPGSPGNSNPRKQSRTHIAQRSPATAWYAPATLTSKLDRCEHLC